MKELGAAMKLKDGSQLQKQKQKLEQDCEPYLHKKTGKCRKEGHLLVDISLMSLRNKEIDKPSTPYSAT